MHEFVAKFDKLQNHILVASQPTARNLKCFFINAQLLEVSFLLRRKNPTDLAIAQQMATSVEDDLILAGKIRKDPNKVRSNQVLDASFSSTNSVDPMI